MTIIELWRITATGLDPWEGAYEEVKQRLIQLDITPSYRNEEEGEVMYSYERLEYVAKRFQ